MQNYKVVWSRRGIRYESSPMTFSAAHQKAEQVIRGSRAVTILKENDGSDHPSNKGKWFLETIIK